ncbi:MAG: T9SS type A sorting domain-containing protein [Flavobacteriales bacterium]|nr:T9SS type A sorting domain-containing protein [Flavobacteriales bacterium]
MRSLLRSLSLLTALAAGGGTFAQLQYWAYVYGQVSGCTPGQVITVTTSFQTVTATVDANCYYWASVYTASNPDILTASTMCQGAVQTVTDSVVFNGILDSALVNINFNCGGGGTPDCLGIPGGPNVPGSPCDDGDPNTFGDVWDANCGCSGQGGGLVDCLGVPNGPDMPGTACDDNDPLTPYSYWAWNCVCVADTTNGFLYDCMGVLNGPAMPGTPCDDGDPNTMGDMWDANCGCSGQGVGFVDCLGVPNGPDMPGTACDDNDPMTSYSFWTWNCVCVADTTNGFLYDCMGVLNGPAMPGTPCDDGDPNTSNDTWDGSCTCVGSGSLPCEADFIVTQAYDSLQGPIPGTIWVFFLNNGGMGFTYSWDFGDGTTSNVPFPTHTYTGNGPYLLCLTVSGFGCTDTFCDSVGVDANGIILPMGAQSQGFTINVMGATTAIDEVEAINELVVAPNPVNDVLTVSLNSIRSGALILEVLDVTGKLIHQQRANLAAGANTLRLDLAHLEAGPYLLRLNTEGTIRTERFVRGH